MQLTPDVALRKLLDEATKHEGDFANHAALVANIPGHTVHPLPSNGPHRPRVDDYNCFTYAFELVDSVAYEIVRKQLHCIGTDAQFVTYLLSKHWLRELSFEKSTDLDIVLYSNAQGPQHAGKLLAGRVISKWGRGLLWDHQIVEVPIIYGDVVQFYRRMRANAAEAAFTSYLASRGIDLQHSPRWRQYIGANHAG
jgi:hypothetical protein